MPQLVISGLILLLSLRIPGRTRRVDMQNSPAQRSDQSGFTLIELVTIIVILGILAGVAIPKFSSISENSKFTATREEMSSLKTAIVGDASMVAGGEFIFRGYEGDCGFAPNQLADLVTKPDSVPVYDKLVRMGWNGPYIDGAGLSYLSDAWGNSYVYQQSNRRLISTGDGADSVIITF